MGQQRLGEDGDIFFRVIQIDTDGFCFTGAVIADQAGMLLVVVPDDFLAAQLGIGLSQGDQSFGQFLTVPEFTASICRQGIVLRQSGSCPPSIAISVP